MTHPAQFSPEVLDALAPHLRRYGLANSGARVEAERIIVAVRP